MRIALEEGDIIDIQFNNERQHDLKILHMPSSMMHPIVCHDLKMNNIKFIKDYDYIILQKKGKKDGES